MAYGILETVGCSQSERDDSFLYFDWECVTVCEHILLESRARVSDGSFMFSDTPNESYSEGKLTLSGEAEFVGLYDWENIHMYLKKTRDCLNSSSVCVRGLTQAAQPLLPDGTEAPERANEHHTAVASVREVIAAPGDKLTSSPSMDTTTVVYGTTIGYSSAIPVAGGSGHLRCPGWKADCKGPNGYHCRGSSRTVRRTRSVGRVVVYNSLVWSP